MFHSSVGSVQTALRKTSPASRLPADRDRIADRRRGDVAAVRQLHARTRSAGDRRTCSSSTRAEIGDEFDLAGQAVVQPVRRRRGSRRSGRSASVAGPVAPSPRAAQMRARPRSAKAPGAVHAALAGKCCGRRSRRRSGRPGARRVRAGVPIWRTSPSAITTSRSAMVSASSWSCVTMIVVRPSWRCSSRISTRTSSRSLASRLESGSSSSSTSGRITSARASATRCCWPPESWRGQPLGEAVEPHQPQRLGDARRAISAVRELAHLQAEGDVLGRPSCAGTARSSGTPCRCCASRAAAQVTSRPPMRIAPPLGCDEARDHAQRRGLAAARRPEQHQELAVARRRASTAVDHGEVAVALATDRLSSRRAIASDHPRAVLT